MGASQSSQGEEASAGDQVKTSYYELLGVERNATQDECVTMASSTLHD